MEAKILDIIRYITKNNDITCDTNLIEDGFLDSLQILRLIVEFEDQFMINISRSSIRINDFISVDSITNMILREQKK